MKKSIGIIDYGSGNLNSIHNSFRKLGCRCKVSTVPEVLESSDYLILPGVGAFKPAITSIREKGLDEIILNHVKKGKPILGICLGMQLLGISSSENGYSKGLGLIKSEVTSIGNKSWHIGWNSIKLIKEDKLFLSSNLKNYYFNHSFAFKDTCENVLCTSVINKKRFASVIRSNNIIGVQFHPEKSQDSGHLLLSSIIQHF